MTEPDEILSAGPAARLLGISTDTLWRWGNDGRVRYSQIPGSKYRRYRRADLLPLKMIEVNLPEDGAGDG